MSGDPYGGRIDYGQRGLTREDLDADPIAQLGLWLAEAAVAGAREPNAMCLATVDENGAPHARFVLLRGLDALGLRFFTNRLSAKARQIMGNPQAAATFWWPECERQVRVEGMVELLSDAESDAYFATRPYESRLAAWASPQSASIPDRNVLEEALDKLRTLYPDQVPRPPHWGGYLLQPNRMEFWQGRPSRLHDRFLFWRADGEWLVERLAP